VVGVNDEAFEGFADEGRVGGDQIGCSKIRSCAVGINSNAMTNSTIAGKRRR